MKHDLSRYDYTRAQVLDMIDSFIFHERNRQILKRRLLDGVRYEDLAYEFDLSVNQVKTICYTGIQKILDRQKLY